MVPPVEVYEGGELCICVCGCGHTYVSRVCIVLRRYSEKRCPKCLDDHPKAVHTLPAETIEART